MDPVQQGNPGGLSCSVCIGAVDDDDVAASFSSVGPVTWTNTSYADYPYTDGSSTQFGLIRPDVCAPGVQIISADCSNTMGYLVASGTSMSTPCAAGCMALMLSKNPELTPAEICRILEETAVSNEPGKSNVYGYGRIDVLAAVNVVPANILSLSSYYIHDEQGNNDHQLNAGEAVTMDLDLVCGDNALNNATLNITTTSEFVTITNGTLTLPDFAPGQSQTLSGFAFTVSDEAPAKRKITFNTDVSIDGASIGHFAFTLAVIGSNLVYESSSITGDDNGNGLFEAGETTNLHIVPIGQAVASNGILPTRSNYNYCLTEQIYTVEELGEAHDIFSVAFFNAGTDKTRNCRIFMQSTGKSVFQNTSDWVAATLDDLLFEGDITFANGEWTTIYFNRAFAYDGIHNVVLIIDDNTGSYSSGMACRVFKDTPNMALYNLSDNTNFDPYTPFDYSGYYLSDPTLRNQVLFGLEDPNQVESFDSSPVTIYPNPAVNMLYIMGEGIRRVEVYNLLGQRIETVTAVDSETVILNLETYEAGLYLLTIHTSDGVTTTKFVKQDK